MTPWLFFVNRQEKVLKLQNRWTNKTFFKKNTFSQKLSLELADCSCDNPGKSLFPTEPSLDQSPKKVWKILFISKTVFPQKLPRIHRLRVSQLWRKISLQVNKRTESEKKSNFSLLKKNFHKLFPRTSIAVLPTLKKVFRHCPENSKIYPKNLEFSRLHSEMLLCKCSTGQVESIFDNPGKNFPAKIQDFLVKIQKRRKTNCSTIFFWYFFLCTLRLLFQLTWLIFSPKSEKTHWKSKRDDNTENYFNYFFSMFSWGHVKCTLVTCGIFLPKYGYFRSETKNDQIIILLSKRASKRSAATVGYSFGKFDRNSHQKFNIFAKRPKTLN